MNPTDPRSDDATTALETRSRALLIASADALDGRVRSRLNQARQAALAEFESAGAVRPFRVPGAWLPAGALAAAAVLAVAVWVARPVGSPSSPLAEASPVEDAELLGASDNPELYADDAEFYEWAGSDAAAANGGEG